MTQHSHAQTQPLNYFNHSLIHCKSSSYQTNSHSPHQNLLIHCIPTRQQNRYIINPSIYNILLPQTRKIFKVTHDASITFKQHAFNIKNRTSPRLNALKSVVNTTIEHKRETTIAVYKQCMRSVIKYTSPAWAPKLATTHLRTSKSIQNRVLRIITG